MGHSSHPSGRSGVRIRVMCASVCVGSLGCTFPTMLRFFKDPPWQWSVGFVQLESADAICMYVCMYVCIYVCVCVCVCVCGYICVCVCVCLALLGCMASEGVLPVAVWC